MLYLKFVCCLSLLLGAFDLEAVKTRSQRHEEDQRKLTRACPEVPISDEDIANMDSGPSKIVLKLEVPNDFKIANTYPHLTKDNHIALSTLTSGADSPVLFYNPDTAFYAVTISGSTFLKDGKIKEITSFTHIAFLFSLTDKTVNAAYAFSDNTSEVRPTLTAKAYAITNLSKVPYSETSAEQHILPYQITPKEYGYFPIQIKVAGSQEISFDPVKENPFSAK